MGLSLKTIKRFSIAICGLWLLGLFIFIDSIPGTPPQGSADAIIVFTGGPDRIKVAETLFRDKRAWYLLISGVHPSVQLHELITVSDADMQRITMDTLSYDTITNVAESSKWIQKWKFQRIFLVTAHYHLPRVMVLFKKRLPTIAIMPYPVITQEFKTPYWWLVPATLIKFMREFHKFLWEQIF